MKYLFSMLVLLLGCSCAAAPPVSPEYVTRQELRDAYECLQARHDYEREATTCRSPVGVATEVCLNTCGPAQTPTLWVGDGECDDGGEDSLFSVCELGTDCQDCGVRQVVIEGATQEEIDLACGLVQDYFEQCPGIR